MMRGTSRHLEVELDVSPVPLGSKGAHDTCVEWLVATVNRRVGGTTHPRITYKNLERETEELKNHRFWLVRTEDLTNSSIAFMLVNTIYDRV